MEKNSLVEDEGVNAGSADQIEDGQESAPTSPESGDARGGGNPEDVEAKAPVDDMEPDGGDGELVGAPEEGGQYPSQTHGSAGQDAGSIE